MTDKKPQTIKSNTVVLHTAATFLLPLQFLFSVFLLLRGHDEPGGGFIAGLVASGAIVLYLFANGVSATRKLMRIKPQDLLGLGLVMCLASTLPGFFVNGEFMTALWWEFMLGESEVKLSTVLIFDIGVYLGVVGTILTIVVSLTEAEE
ncbi:Na+/H+ antiporter subunit B [Salinispirillum sp. LH 10-3-1]|uniref:Na+/H+ antiporter subunit B n=1 Tax=Salinispirillum sp. LH 10-3-1 TaxID=2952525 RepID=A0AB38YE40_9GAMM